MKKLTRTILSLCLVLTISHGYSQFLLGKHYSNPKRLIPVQFNQSSNEIFCLCEVVSLTANNIRRTDAIFAERNSEAYLSNKRLLRNIDYELQQAMVFFDSYKIIHRYASPVSCDVLSDYLKKNHEEFIDKITVLLPSYATR